MYRTSLVGSAVVLVVALVTPSAHVSAQQLRRSAAGDGSGPPPGAVHGIPRNARLPFAGVWDGTFALSDAERGDHQISIVLLLEVADSAKAVYDGSTILPNGARAPHLATTVRNGEMRWKQQNSGGGFWVYTAKFVSRDSIAGTVILEDWPQLPAGEKPPAGTIALVRRPAGK